MYDIKIKDKARIRPIKNEQEWDKLYKFIKYNFGRDESEYFKSVVKSDNSILEKAEVTIEQILKTNKTQTDFVVGLVKFSNGILARSVFPSRLVNVYWRKNNHKLTKIFSDFWQPKV